MTADKHILLPEVIFLNQNNIADYLLLRWLSRAPDATANINGAEGYPQIKGTSKFYQTELGVLVVSNVNGLPYNGERCGGRIYGMHIHDGLGCIGSTAGGYTDIGFHYNPENCPHPAHAGDLLPLFANRGGYALSAFLTERFRVSEVIGRPLFIHSNPDDFTSQPAGNAGKAIACGVILR